MHNDHFFDKSRHVNSNRASPLTTSMTALYCTTQNGTDYCTTPKELFFVSGEEERPSGRVE